MTHERQRHVKDFPCPVCAGFVEIRQGKGERCYGFTTGRRTFCTREEFAGQAPWNDGAKAYKHARDGWCVCGIPHGDPTVVYYPNGRTTAEPEPLDPNVVDCILREYWTHCPPLSHEQIEFLKKREKGTIDLITARLHNYRRLPALSDIERIVDRCIQLFGRSVMERCPGFYTVENGTLKTHCHTETLDAICIPAIDHKNRLQAFVRMYTKGNEQKYKNFTGTSSSVFYTMGGDMWAPGIVRALWVIEGIHKAHVVGSAGSVRTMGIPGTYFSPDHLKAVCDMRPEVVIEAYDADKETNPNVERERHRLHTSLREAGLYVKTAEWDSRDGKGLDDLIKNGKAPHIREVVSVTYLQH